MQQLIEKYRDQERSKEVEKYDILDTLPEKEFDSLVELAAIITESPMSQMNLLHKNRQWTKAAFGLESGTEKPRSETICTYTIEQDNNFEISDLTKNEHFKDAPYVEDDPHLRFYSGYPLKTKRGFNIGAICVLDTKPRQLTDIQRNALKTIAEEIIARLEIRRTQQKLEKLNREKDHFLRAVNHDIKSPLNGIISSTHYLQNLWEGDREELDKILSMIEISGRKLVNYTSELVTNAIEDGESQLNIDEVQVKELINDLIHIYTPLATAKGVNLITETNSEETFFLDDEKFKLIVSNLISNALKFSSRDDTIKIKIEISGENDRIIHCYISDTGIGIPEEFIPNLFIKKKEHQRKGTQGEISTGLGLPLVKQYVDLHNGKIKVQTTEGEGTTFYVSIPEQRLK